MPSFSKIKASIVTRTKSVAAARPRRSQNGDIPMPAAVNAPPYELEAERRSTAARERAQYLYDEEQRRLKAQQKQQQNEQLAIEQNRRLQERKEQAEAEKQIRERQQNASAESVRRLRGLIRERYRLDLYVWSKRNVQKANQKIIVEDCAKADTILQEIYFIVGSWEQDLFDPEEWKTARKIKESLLRPNIHAVWTSVPPWDYEEDDEGEEPRSPQL